MAKFYFIVLGFFYRFCKKHLQITLKFYGTIKEVKTHQYNENDNLKFLTIDGTFKITQILVDNKLDLYDYKK